jgi:hypothetical protein
VFRAAALLIVLAQAAGPAAYIFCPDLCDEPAQSQSAGCRHGAMPDSIGASDRGTCDLAIGTPVFAPESVKRVLVQPASAPAGILAPDALSAAGISTHAARLAAHWSTTRHSLPVVLRV